MLAHGWEPKSLTDVCDQLLDQLCGGCSRGLGSDLVPRTLLAPMALNESTSFNSFLLSVF